MNRVQAINGIEKLCRFKQRPNTTILDLSNLKEFADNKQNVNKTLIFLFDRVENTVGYENKRAKMALKRSPE